MLSQLAAVTEQPDGAMDTLEVISTAALLLIAGHETTVNLITDGMLTLLRHPDVLQRLREDPQLSVPIVEELQRYQGLCGVVISCWVLLSLWGGTR